MIRIGVLSDTHLSGSSPRFKQQVESCFAGTDMILHAGDLTGIGVLAAFGNKEIYAVCGNMCSSPVQAVLPAKRVVTVGGFTIALTHGAFLGNDIEGKLLEDFAAADCIVYGHTHRPVCHTLGQVLLVNPGSFTATGRYGAPGTYAVIEINQNISARIYEVGNGPWK